MFQFHLNLRTTVMLLVLVSMFSISSPAGPMYYNYDGIGSPNWFPFGWDTGVAVNWLFLPGDLSQPTPLPAGNMINKVYFYALMTNGDPTYSATYTDLTIKMAQDDITTLTVGEFYPGPWETVYFRSSVTLDGDSHSWFAITLDTPFLYDPARSLIVYVEQSEKAGSNVSIYGLYEYDIIRRVWDYDGPPFDPTGNGNGIVPHFGVDVMPSLMYTVVRDKTCSIKFEDAIDFEGEDDCLGEDGSVETDTFVVTVDQACNEIEVSVKAGKCKDSGTLNSESGPFLIELCGFEIELIAPEIIDPEAPATYGFVVTSDDDNKTPALGNITFDFCGCAEIVKPEEGYFPIDRDEY